MSPRVSPQNSTQAVGDDYIRLSMTIVGREGSLPISRQKQPEMKIPIALFPGVANSWFSQLGIYNSEMWLSRFHGTGRGFHTRTGSDFRLIGCSGGSEMLDCQLAPTDLATRTNQILDSEIINSSSDMLLSTWKVMTQAEGIPPAAPLGI